MISYLNLKKMTVKVLFTPDKISDKEVLNQTFLLKMLAQRNMINKIYQNEIRKKQKNI